MVGEQSTREFPTAHNRLQWHHLEATLLVRQPCCKTSPTDCSLVVRASLAAPCQCHTMHYICRKCRPQSETIALYIHWATWGRHASYPQLKLINFCNDVQNP
eukprot:5831613-Amphidinium_carterae.1